MDDCEVDDSGANSALALTATSSSYSRQQSRPMIVDQRKSNAIIERSSFPGAMVAPTLKKQCNSTNTYSQCTFICGGQQSRCGSFVTQPSNEIEQDGNFSSLGSAEVMAARGSFCCRQSETSLRCVSDSQNEEDAASSADFTRLSDKISFYNVAPLRTGSRVYKGTQKHAVDISRNVAVKLVPYSKENLQEIRVLLDLAEHMNVVNIIESDIIFGHVREIYIVMELCTQNLWEYVSKQDHALPNFEKNASFSKQLMTGLDFIHSKSIVHSDINPDNILFSQSLKTIKISNFGNSKYQNHGISLNHTSSAIGEGGFRAPELYCTPPRISKASDMFSMATSMFYLLTNGGHPFGESPHDWCYHIRHGRKEDLTLLSNLDILSSKKSQLLNIMGAILHRFANARPDACEVLQSPFFAGISCYVGNTPRVETSSTCARHSTCTSEFSFHATTSLQCIEDAHPTTSNVDNYEPIICDPPDDAFDISSHSLQATSQSQSLIFPPSQGLFPKTPTSSSTRSGDPFVKSQFSGPPVFSHPTQSLGLFSPKPATSSNIIPESSVRSTFHGWLTHTDLGPPSVGSSIFSPNPRVPCSPIVLSSDDSRPATAFSVVNRTFPTQHRSDSPIVISSDEDEEIDES